MNDAFIYLIATADTWPAIVLVWAIAIVLMAAIAQADE